MTHVLGEAASLESALNDLRVEFEKARDARRVFLEKRAKR